MDVTVKNMYTGELFSYNVNSPTMTVEEFKQNMAQLMSSNDGEYISNLEFLQIYVNYEIASEDEKVIDLV